MERFLEILLLNAASATLLAICVAGITRFVERPAIRHALWLLVLLKLVTPPVLEISVLPASLLPSSATPLTEATLPSTGATALPAVTLPTIAESSAPVAADPVTVSTPAPLIDPQALWRNWLLPLWLVGSAALTFLTLFRALRFERLIARARPADEALLQRVAALAASVGIDKVPGVALVRGNLPPLLWAFGSRRRLLLPEPLLGRLSGDERDALIAHELCHLKRGDTWVRHLETLTVLAFWWHPVAWWARRQLRESEEQACDAQVVALRPDLRRAYADGLLKTLEFLSEPRGPLPAFASGAILHTPQLKERLVMIMQRPTSPGLRLWQRAAIALPFLAALLIFPTWMQPVAGEGSPAERELALAEQKLMEEKTRIELLERELATERNRRSQEQYDLAKLKTEYERAYAQAEELQAAGRSAEAAELIADAERRRERLEYDRRLTGLDREHARAQRPAELELRKLKEEIARAHALGREGAVAELQQHATDLMRDMERAEFHARNEQLERAERLLERELYSLNEARDRQLANDHVYEAERSAALARELAVQARELDRERARLRGHVAAAPEPRAEPLPELRDEPRRIRRERREPRAPRPSRGVTMTLPAPATAQSPGTPAAPGAPGAAPSPVTITVPRATDPASSPLHRLKQVETERLQLMQRLEAMEVEAKMTRLELERLQKLSRRLEKMLKRTEERTDGVIR
ncbi:hypothetical protein ABI59_05605 [Acidobacteria bacterium Mor1]|nr:hypothetical protein ABI59_05605 [Acidobacteria bacterium Mor1]